MILFLEPLGNDYWLAPEETFVVVAEAEPGFEVNVMPEYVIVVINEGDPFDVKVIDAATNAVLECGHGRPADWPPKS